MVFTNMNQSIIRHMLLFLTVLLALVLNSAHAFQGCSESYHPFNYESRSEGQIISNGYRNIPLTVPGLRFSKISGVWNKVSLNKWQIFLEVSKNEYEMIQRNDPELSNLILYITT